MLVFLCFLGLIHVAFASDGGALRPVNVAVIVKTDGAHNSDTDDGAQLCLSISGRFRCIDFPNLKGDDMMKHKTDWFEWSASSFYGWNRLDQLRAITVDAKGNDGWKFEDISLFVEDENNNWHTVAMHHDVNQWVDRDGSQVWYYVNMNVNRWTSCMADGHITQVQVFIETDDAHNAGSDHNPELTIRSSKGHVDKTTLGDLDGNDMLENKSDWWVWNLNRAYKPYEINAVVLHSGGSDGWKPRKAMVIARTNTGQYQVVAFDRYIGWLDDRGYELLSLRLCPFEYGDTTAYWGVYGNGNGGQGTMHGISFSFSDSSSNQVSTTKSKELFQSTTETETTGFETGFAFKGLSASAKHERSTSNTNSRTVSNSVSNGISSSISSSVNYVHEARTPDGMPRNSFYTLYTKDIYRKHNYGDGSTLVTFDYIFKWGPCRDVHPNCVSSSYCVEGTGCMRCRIPEAYIDRTFAGVRSECIPPEMKRCAPDDLDWSCCTTANPCDEGQGDCDRDSDCKGNMVCLHDTHHHRFDTCGYN